jgi:hypothetical protein
MPKYNVLMVLAIINLTNKKITHVVVKERRSPHVGCLVPVRYIIDTSGPSRWLIGSVADRVMRRATVPVLLVRADKES